MAKEDWFLFLFLVFLCNSVSCSNDFEVVWGKEQLFPSIHTTMMEYFRHKMTEIASPSPPTNPVTTSPITSAPGIVTVPSTNPPPVTTPPATNPINTPVTNPPPVTTPPATNPITTTPFTNPPPVTTPPATNPINTTPITNPPPATNPINTPVTNPVNTPVPVMTPSTTPATPAGGNGRWCIAKNGASQAALQAALDYACGTGGADCASIQQGSSCYEPPTLQNHASYAFNSYYQKNPAPTSCDFEGAAALTTTNPSTGTCVYPSSAATTQTPVNPTSLPTAPATQAPVNTTIQAPVNPTTTFPGSQYPPPPPGFSFGNPDPTGLGAFGASPPLTNTVSVSNTLRPSLVTLASIIIIMFGQPSWFLS